MVVIVVVQTNVPTKGRPVDGSILGIGCRSTERERLTCFVAPIDSGDGNSRDGCGVVRQTELSVGATDRLSVRRDVHAV